MSNIIGTFSSVNEQVGKIADDVGQTPSGYMPEVFELIRNLSETVIMPIAGIILTFVTCYEFIQMIISHNNLASFETWFIFRWIFKTFVAVELITHTFDITMAVFDLAQNVVDQAGGLIQESTSINEETLQALYNSAGKGHGGTAWNIPAYVHNPAVNVYTFGTHICNHKRAHGGDLPDGIACTDTVCDIRKQRTGNDGAELFKRSFCACIPGLSDNDMCRNICGSGKNGSIFRRQYNRLTVEGSGNDGASGIYVV